MFCSSCGKTIEEGSAFCKECGAPARPVPPPPVAGYTPPPPPPGYTSPPPPGYPPGWQAPPPRRRTGLIVGIVAAVVIVLAGAGVGAYFGLRSSDSDKTASSSTTASLSTTTIGNSTSSSLAEVSTTVTIPSIGSSTSGSDTSASTTSSLASSTTASLGSTTTTSLTPPPDSRLHTPASGSAERKAILDALRVPVEKELNQAVLFVIDTFNVEKNFAFVLGQTVQPSGAPIDYSKTPYLQEVQDGVFSDEGMGLLHWSGGSWKVLTYDVGATDVAWLDWAQQYGAPDAIFPPLGD